MYRAFGADEHGSTYLKAFSTYLREEYLQRPLDRIYLMVKQHMAKTVQVGNNIYITSGNQTTKKCTEWFKKTVPVWKSGWQPS